MQNYPVYEVLRGTTLPALGTPTEVYIVQQGSPTTTAGPPYQWMPSPPDPANLAVVNNNANIPGNVYVVGTGTNGTYASSAAAQTAANAYCQSLATARDQAAAQKQYKGGDATQALSNPTVELGPI